MHICPIFSDFFDKKLLLLSFLVQKSFWRSLWGILQYNFLFSAYFAHSFQKQPKTEDTCYLIYPLWHEKCILSILTKNNDNDTFSLNPVIFNIYYFTLHASSRIRSKSFELLDNS